MLIVSCAPRSQKLRRCHFADERACIARSAHGSIIAHLSHNQNMTGEPLMPCPVVAQVAEAFMASLQNAIVPCSTQLQPTIQPPAQLGSPEYSQAVANGCCSIISRCWPAKCPPTACNLCRLHGSKKLDKKPPFSSCLCFEYHGLTFVAGAVGH